MCESLDKSIQMCGEIVSVFVSATFCTRKGYLNISLQLDMGWLVLELECHQLHTVTKFSPDSTVQRDRESEVFAKDEMPTLTLLNTRHSHTLPSPPAPAPALRVQTRLYFQHLGGTRLWPEVSVQDGGGGKNIISPPISLSLSLIFLMEFTHKTDHC